MTGPRGSEHVTLNFESDDDVKDQVFVKPLNKQYTVSEEEVVMAEDLLDKLLENVLDLIDQISNLRKQVDAQNFPSSDKLNAAIESVGGFRDHQILQWRSLRHAVFIQTAASHGGSRIWIWHSSRSPKKTLRLSLCMVL